MRAARVLVAATIFGACLMSAPAPVASAWPAMTGLHVVGNELHNGDDARVRLIGVNRGSTEFVCRAEGLGDGFALGPTDDAAVAAMAEWNMNAVRVLVAEDCWFGVGDTRPGFGGAVYQGRVRDFIERLSAHGFAAILDLHLVGSMPRVRPCPDHFDGRSCNAPQFWSEAANAFKDLSNVVFDLFNEPTTSENPESTGGDTPEDWGCWRDGGAACATSDIGIPDAVGMQTLVDAVRATGAGNPILLGGPRYAGDLARWLEYMPVDPAGQLMASVHAYKYLADPTPTDPGPTYFFTDCATVQCFEAEIRPVADAVPVVIGEFGEEDCRSKFAKKLMTWADRNRVSYLAWSWRTYEPPLDEPTCRDLSVIASYDGTPTNYGKTVRKHMRALKR